MNEIVILFDEQGTPTFRKDRERLYFIGIAVAYDINREQLIFDECDDLFGLSNSKPLKNDKIKKSRALEITDKISTLDIMLNIASIDLNNEELFNTIKLYEEFGNLFREKVRKIRGRPISQILHNYLLDHILFSIIHEHVKLYQKSSLFSSFIDNWSIPQNDLEIVLEWASESIQQRSNDITRRFFPNVTIHCNKIELLKEDSKRKRFIDVVASVISRDYLTEEDEKYSGNIISTITQNYSKRIFVTDYTQRTIELMRIIMDDISRNG